MSRPQRTSDLDTLATFTLSASSAAIEKEKEKGKGNENAPMLRATQLPPHFPQK
jgi:hypothetical protein